MRAVLLSADVLLMAAAQGAADRHGVDLIVSAGSVRAIEACATPATRLVVIDLRLAGLDVWDFVRQVRSAAAQAAIVACGPHVHTQLIAEAAAAGCDEVITRGEFDRRIAGLLAALTAPGP